MLFINKITHFLVLSTEKHNVLVYIEDAIVQLLDHKDENPKVNSTKFLSE